MALSPSTRPPTSASSTSGGVGSSDRLLELAEVLVDAHDPDAGPALVRVATHDDDVQIGVLPVPVGLDPFDLLACAHTPAEWTSLGIVYSGRIVEVADASAGVPRRRPGRHVGAALVRRDGTSVAVLAEPGERRCVVSGPDEPMVGRLADALRRSLGLPTPPPASGVGGAIARVWLHRVHTVAVDGRPVDADVVAALRPPMPRSWADLRQQCTEGAWAELGCDPDLAEWMDDGMFSRWCAVSFPDPVEVLVDLTELAATGAAAPLAEALSAWR